MTSNSRKVLNVGSDFAPYVEGLKIEGKLAAVDVHVKDLNRPLAQVDTNRCVADLRIGEDIELQVSEGRFGQFFS